MTRTRVPAETRPLRIVKVGNGARRTLRDIVIRESPVTIFLNDVELVTFMCSPKDLEQLAVGFLYSEGVIKDSADLVDVLADYDEGVVWVKTKGRKKRVGDLLSRRLITTGCGRGLSFHDSSLEGKGLRIRSRLKTSAGELIALMGEFQKRSTLYKLTGGVHSAALCDETGILVLKEDIGRHSAIDKVLGESLLRGIRTDDRILVTSGRISSEMLIKAARAHIPIVLSKSAPTDLGVGLAKEFGITLVGFVRGTRMNVYSGTGRISSRA